MNSQNNNILLKEAFSKLASLEKERFISAYKNSPLVLKLVEFLEKQKESNFNTRNCIQYVYGADTNAADYKVIENRFFKLRKKLIDALAENKTEKPQTNVPDEELELRACVDLFNDGQKDLAHKRLEILESNCWKKNIFELLPRIIDRLIFCNQTFNRLEKNTALYKRADSAIKLSALTQQILKNVRRIYEINYLKGISAADNELRFIKKIADKYKQYPRFSFIYHYVSLYYKLGSSEYIDKMDVLGKHHSALKKIYQTSGKYTVFYIPNYEYYQEIHLKEISMFYYYNRCQFEEAYQESNELKKFINKNQAAKAESFFYNAFRSELAAGHYSDAQQTINEYTEELRKNNRSEKLPVAYTLQMMLYVYAYPKIKPTNIPYMENMFEQYIKWSRENKNLLVPTEEAVIIKTGYNFINGRYAENLKLIKNETLAPYFEKKELYDAFVEYNTLFASKEKNTTRVTKLKDKLNALQFKVLTPNSVLLLKRMIDFLNKG
jgi:hypothetical protein